MQTPDSLQNNFLEKQFITRRHFVSNFQLAAIHWSPHCCKARSFDISFAQQKSCDLTSQKIHLSFPLSSYKLRLRKPMGASTSTAGTLDLRLSCASISDRCTHWRPKIWDQAWSVWLGRSSVIKVAYTKTGKTHLKTRKWQGSASSALCSWSNVKLSTASGEQTAAPLNLGSYFYEYFLVPLLASQLLLFL